jgi:hypothetical protein
MNHGCNRDWWDAGGVRGRTAAPLREQLKESGLTAERRAELEEQLKKALRRGIPNPAGDKPLLTSFRQLVEAGDMNSLLAPLKDGDSLLRGGMRLLQTGTGGSQALNSKLSDLLAAAAGGEQQQPEVEPRWSKTAQEALASRLAKKQQHVADAQRRGGRRLTNAQVALQEVLDEQAAWPETVARLKQELPFHHGIELDTRGVLVPPKFQQRALPLGGGPKVSVGHYTSMAKAAVANDM